MGLKTLETLGWAKFPSDSGSRAWAEAALTTGRHVLADPAMRAQWLQCEGTWFVGVDALPTAPDGSIAGVPLDGPAIRALNPLPPLHRAQLSVTYPGYPRPREGEGDAAFRYRLRRDAAHVDGVIADGPERRRRIREPHAWILGLPLTLTDPAASPLVIWEGSHRMIGDALRGALACHPPAQWGEVDITEVYQAVRRRCFETCRRVTLSAVPGEALLLHRLTVHGIAPWADGATAPPDGRMIAYFRPPIEGGPLAWLQL
jgi:hypothetical protein